MATYERRPGKTSSLAGATLALLALAGLLGSQDLLARRWSDFFRISLRIAMDALPSLSQGAWQISQPYIQGHLRVLEGLLQICGSCWQMVLTLARVA